MESRLFEAPEHAPSHEGWVDSPAKVNATAKAKANGKETDQSTDAKTEERQGLLSQGKQGEVLSFKGLSDDELREIASETGVKIDKRWGRAKLEQALRDAN